MADVTALLWRLGVDAGPIHMETSGSVSGRTASRAPREPSRPSTRRPEVSLRARVSVRFDHVRWRSPLELARTLRRAGELACRIGVCQRCESAMVAGEVD
jgi:hypothetical protein